MALVLIEGEEKLPDILKMANESVTPLNPKSMTFEGSDASTGRAAQGSFYMVLFTCLTGFATPYVVHG